jgi:hypothetical protein
MKTYDRICPNCNVTLSYSSYKNLWRANKNNVPCSNCSKKLPKKPKLKQYKRNCPTCNKILYYSSKETLKKAKDKECQSCVQRPLSIGRIHTEETKNKIKNNHSKYWLGKKKPMSDETKRKIRISTIDFINKNVGQCFPRYNPHACSLFEKINNDFNLNGRHAENGGEFYIKDLGYWVDYYEPTYNLVIEYYEKYHERDNVVNKDKIRLQQITKALGCDIIIFKENDDVNNLYITLKEVLCQKKN